LRVVVGPLLVAALAACHPAAQPDWSGGRWERNSKPGDAPDIGQTRGDALPLTPEWRKKSDELDAKRAAGVELRGNDAQCIPSGMPFMMLANAFEVLYSPGRIGIIAGSRGLQIRNLWVDGRAHTPDQFLLDSYGGESVGHWEGDTLVVDTLGLRAGNELVYGLKRRRWCHPGCIPTPIRAIAITWWTSPVIAFQPLTARWIRAPAARAWI
jgi:hypothetical protein